MRVLIPNCHQAVVQALPQTDVENSTKWLGSAVWFLTLAVQAAKIAPKDVEMKLMSQAYAYNPVRAGLPQLEKGNGDVLLFAHGLTEYSVERSGMMKDFFLKLDQKFQVLYLANCMVYPLDSSYIFIASKKQVPVVSGDFLLKVFDLRTLLFLFLSIAASVIFFACFRRREGQPFEWSANGMVCAGLVLRQGPKLSVISDHPISKGYLLLYDLTMSMLTHAFFVIIISVIVLPNTPKQINSLSELVTDFPQHRIVLLKYMGAKKVLQELQMPQSFMDRVEEVDLAYSPVDLELPGVLDRMFYEENVVLIISSYNFENILHLSYSLKKAHLFHTSGPISSTRYFSYGMRRRMTPALEKLYNGMAYITDLGLYKYFNGITTYYMPLYMLPHFIERDAVKKCGPDFFTGKHYTHINTKAFTLLDNFERIKPSGKLAWKHMKWCFLLLLLGLIVASIGFAAELMSTVK